MLLRSCRCPCSGSARIGIGVEFPRISTTAIVIIIVAATVRHVRCDVSIASGSFPQIFTFTLLLVRFAHTGLSVVQLSRSTIFSMIRRALSHQEVCCLLLYVCRRVSPKQEEEAESGRSGNCHRRHAFRGLARCRLLIMPS